MFLFRALNDYDIASNPLKNGLASKVMINDLAKKCYENDKFYKSLEDKEKEWYIKQHVVEYLNNYNYKLDKLFDKNSRVTREDVLEYRRFLEFIKGMSVDDVIELVKCNRSGINFGSYIKFMNYLSTLQGHLLYGSTKDTDWISTSTDLNGMMKYYNSQRIHKVAVIKSDTNGVFDSDNIMSVDVSNLDKIEKNNMYLCNKLNVSDDVVINTMAELSNIDPTIMFGFKNNMVNHTNINSRGFKYSVKSKEVCMLRYIPSDHLLSILDAIQMDIIMAGRFDGSFIYMSPSEQEKELNRFKNILFNRLKLFGDNYLLYLFDELYVKNRNVVALTSVSQSKEYIEKNKRNILRLSLKIPSPMIKR